MPATRSLSDERCEAETPDGAACPEPVLRRRNGVPMCQGHVDADVKAQKSETNANYAASSRLTKPQVQALRDGLAVLAKASADHAEVYADYKQDMNDTALGDRYYDTRQDVVDATSAVLAHWWDVLPEPLLPSEFDFTSPDGPDG